MPSTFFGLSIASSGISTYSAGLNTTGHNIANVKTKGYTKQTALQSANDPISLGTSYGMIGTGSQVTSIVSSRDEYYDYKFRKNNAVYGNYEAKSYYMKNIEDYMYVADEKSGGLTNAFDSMNATLTKLTTDPTDTTLRAEFVGYADSVSRYLNEMSTNFRQLQSDVNTEIKNTVDKINAYGKQIASLNKQINTVEIYGERANDLRDQRALILDKLSELADVDVQEKAPAEGEGGLTQFIVSINGGTLVDSEKANEIKLTARETKDNILDVDGLYTMQWSNGQDFYIHGNSIGGKLQGLLNVRDGNNSDNFKAKIIGYDHANSEMDGKSTVTLKVPASSVDNGSNLAKLNIPPSDGLITINKVDYRYDSFNVSIDADGNYTYTFALKSELTDGNIESIDNAIKVDGDGTIGDAVDFRGVPYYMAQLNEFARTYAANFNQVQDTGYDLYGNIGEDLFTAENLGTGNDMELSEYLRNTSDGFYYLNGYKVVTQEKKTELEDQGYSFEPVDGDDEADDNFYYLVNNKGEKTEKVYIPEDEGNVYQFSSVTKDQGSSYYSINAMTIGVKSKFLKNGSLLACAKQDPTKTGKAEGDNLSNMLKLKDSQDMFKQGDPGSFLRVMVATAGVDSDKIQSNEENSKNIVDEVDNRRMSTAGVDEDEEGQNLIVFQNLLHYQYQVINVMNEVLDRLINSTGV